MPDRRSSPRSYVEAGILFSSAGFFWCAQTSKSYGAAVTEFSNSKTPTFDACQLDSNRWVSKNRDSTWTFLGLSGSRDVVGARTPLVGDTDEKVRVQRAAWVNQVACDVQVLPRPVGWRPRRAPGRREERGKGPLAHRGGSGDHRGAVGLPVRGEHGAPTGVGTRGDDVEDHEKPARHRTRRAPVNHRP